MHLMVVAATLFPQAVVTHPEEVCPVILSPRHQPDSETKIHNRLEYGTGKKFSVLRYTIFSHSVSAITKSSRSRSSPSFLRPVCSSLRSSLSLVAKFDAASKYVINS